MCSPIKTVERRRASLLLLYYITDRRQFPGDPSEQESLLVEKVIECASAGVDYVQLREKDLSARKLEDLARRARAAIPTGSPTMLLINSRIDVTLAVGAHGVHLPADDLRPSDARAIMVRAGMHKPIIAASAHTLGEIALAESHGADFAVFAPVFEKEAKVSRDGLDHLRQVCRRPQAADPPMAVLALGGVTPENAQACVAAGAGGIAGIRLFQRGAVLPLVKRLRSLVAQ